MENEFLRRSDVDQDLCLFEMKHQNDLLIPIQGGDIRENILESPDPSRNYNDESGLYHLIIKHKVKIEVKCLVDVLISMERH